MIYLIQGWQVVDGQVNKGSLSLFVNAMHSSALAETICAITTDNTTVSVSAVRMRVWR